MNLLDMCREGTLRRAKGGLGLGLASPDIYGS